MLSFLNGKRAKVTFYTPIRKYISTVKMYQGGRGACCQELGCTWNSLANMCSDDDDNLHRNLEDNTI